MHVLHVIVHYIVIKVEQVAYVLQDTITVQQIDVYHVIHHVQHVQQTHHVLHVHIQVK